MTGKKTLEKPGLFQSFSNNNVQPGPANKATEGALDAVLSL